MQEYFEYVNSVNSKIKRNFSDVDHYAKLKTLDRLSEKLSSLVKQNEASLQGSNLDFVKEITKITS